MGHNMSQRHYTGQDPRSVYKGHIVGLFSPSNLPVVYLLTNYDKKGVLLQDCSQPQYSHLFTSVVYQAYSTWNGLRELWRYCKKMCIRTRTLPRMLFFVREIIGHELIRLF